MSIEAAKLFVTVGADTRGAETGLLRVDRLTKQTGQGLDRLSRSKVKVETAGAEQSVRGLGRVIDQTRAKADAFKTNYGQGFLSSFGINRGDGLGSLLGSASGRLLNAGVSAAAGKMGEMVERGLTFNDTLENAQISFKHMLGDAEKAKSFIDQMVRFGTNSPFETKDVLTYSQALLSVKVEAQDTEKYLTAMGGALTKASKFERMPEALMGLTQILRKDKMGSEEMTQQLSEHGFDAWGYLSRGLGMSTKDTMKLSEEGRLNAREGVRVMIEQAYREDGALLNEMMTTRVGKEAMYRDMLTTRAAGAFNVPGGLFPSMKDSLDSRIKDLEGGGGQGFFEAMQRTGSVVGYANRVWGENEWKEATGRKEVFGLVQSLQDGSLPQKAKDTAANVVTTMAETLKGGVDAAKGAGTTLAEGAYQGLAGFWEIESPSKRAIRVGEWISEGLEIGLSKRQAGNYARLKDLSQREPEFVKKLVAGSVERGINPDHLANLLAMESSFDPQADNKTSSAYGLIQWMASTRKQFGLTQEGLSQMNATDQLDWVFKYFDQPHLKGKLGTQAALYSAVGAGQASNDDNAIRFRQGSKGYNANKIWDVNKDGLIRQGEFGPVAYNALGAGGKFSLGNLGVSRSAPMPVTVVHNEGNAVSLADEWKYKGTQVTDFGNAVPLSQAARFRQQSHNMIEDPVPVEILVTANREMELLSTTIEGLGTSIVPKTARSFEELSKQLGVDTDRIAANRAAVIAPEEGKKKKRDKLFDRALTREGVAGDFQNSFGDLLGSIGRDKPLNLLKNFGMGMLGSVQQRAGNDISSWLTGALFGGRKDAGDPSGGLSGGLFSGLSKWFGGLFGGGKASGGPVEHGKFYRVGERGEEWFAPGMNGQIIPNHALPQKQRSTTRAQQAQNMRIILVDNERAAEEHYNTSDEAFVLQVRRNRTQLMQLFGRA